MTGSGKLQSEGFLIMRHYLQYSFPIENLIGKNFGTVKHLSENVFDSVMSWDCGNHVFEYSKDYLHGDYGTFEEGLTLLQGLLPMTQKEIAYFEDDIESDILRAMEGAYRNNYENGIFEEINDCAYTWCNELQASGYFWEDINGKPCEFYECAGIVFYYTQKQFEKVILPDALENEYVENKSALRDYAEREYCFEQWFELVTPRPINWGLFDYHGGRFDCEGWQELLKDYAESPWLIEKARKEYQHKQKEALRNHAPMQARAELATNYCTV